MLIILEGIDKCGKSTFAERFKDIAEIIHCTKDDDMVEMLRKAAKSANSGKLVILDRNFLSEMCYGPVYRGTMQITPIKMMHICKILKATKHCILYFSRPEGEKKYYDKNDEFEKDIDKLWMVERRYRNYILQYKNRFNIYEIQYK